MGTNVSTNISEKTNTIVNNTINNYSTNIENSASFSASSNQMINLKFKRVNCGILSVKQFNSVKLNIINSNIQGLTTAITTALKNNLEGITSNVIEQQNKDLTFGQTNISTITEKLDNYVSNSLQNDISYTLKNTFSSDSSNSQQLFVDVEGSVMKECKFDQDAIVENISRNITQTIMSNFIGTFSDQELKSITQNETTQKNTGINPFMILGIVAGVIALICGIVVIAMFFSPKESGFTNVANNAIDKAA